MAKPIYGLPDRSVGMPRPAPKAPPAKTPAPKKPAAKPRPF